MSNVKKVLVTGGAGFIGSNFVYYLINYVPQTQITVLDKLTYAGNRNNLPSEISKTFNFIKGDICDKELVDELVKENDIVVHFAAESHNDNSLESPESFINTNLVGTYVLIDACKKYSKRYHHISTDEVYGDLPLKNEANVNNGLDFDDRFTEKTAYNPSSPYSATKAGSDLLVRAWVRSFDLQATISNCSNNYGPKQHIEKFIPRQITNILMGLKPKLYGNGLNVRDWIHVDDHSRAVWNVIERGVIGETYLIGVNNERANIDILQKILKLMGKSPDYYEFVNDRKGHDRRYGINASKIYQELGFKPNYTNFEEGLMQTIQWYTNNRDWWIDQKDDVENKYSKKGQ